MLFNANGFANRTLTCATEAQLDVGTPVVMTDNYTVAAAQSGDPLFGVACGGRGGVCAVQVLGAVTLPYTGDAPAVGYGKLSCDGEGAVQVDEDGTPVRILAVEPAAGTVTCIL